MFHAPEKQAHIDADVKFTFIFFHHNTSDYTILTIKINGSALLILWKGLFTQGQRKRSPQRCKGELFFQVQRWCYSDWVAGCSMAF